MNDNQDNSALALVRSLHDGLADLKARAEQESETARRTIEAIKWNWKKLSEEQRLGINELTDEKIAELNATYSENTQHLERVRLTQIKESGFAAWRKYEDQWDRKDLLAF